MTLTTTPILATPAPGFTLPATGGHDISLSALLGKTVVLYFYPKDNTSGCANEARQFRDLYPGFIKANALVLGVSRDTVSSHEKFKAKENLPFELLFDKEEKVCRQFGVIRQKVMYGKSVRGIERSTFVIDKSGILRHEWRRVKVENHAQEVLRFILLL